MYIYNVHMYMYMHWLTMYRYIYNNRSKLDYPKARRDTFLAELGEHEEVSHISPLLNINYISITFNIPGGDIFKRSIWTSRTEGMYSRGHKKVNVSYSFYDCSLIRSVFTIKNRFNDYNRFFKTIATVICNEWSRKTIVLRIRNVNFFMSSTVHVYVHVQCRECTCTCT